MWIQRKLSKRCLAHVYIENEPAMKRSKAVLNNLAGEFYTIEANDKIPDRVIVNTHWH